MPRILHQFLPTLTALLIKLYVTIVVITSKKIMRIDTDVDSMLQRRNPVIMFFWHNRIMLIPYFTKHYKSDAAAVVSTHGDGEYVTKFLQLHKLKTLRGSSRTGAMQAAKNIIHSLHTGTSIAVTPDGPKGPRYTINSNAQKIAAKLNVPVLLCCYSTSRSVIVRSWDRFIIPLPFSTIIFEITTPIILKDGEAGETKLLQERMVKQADLLDQELGLRIE
ncbi:MAG: DUF374 domain-containing protein [Proteobacteria bacterium]|nr:DUF374 domain-containing protein [Pseudomonadota bacterium]